MEWLLAQQDAAVMITASTLTAWMVGVLGFIIVGMLTLCFWFLRNMHAKAEAQLAKIETCLEPMPLMAQNLKRIDDTVTVHAEKMPKIDTTLALMQERHSAHDVKIETHAKELDRLRDWRHHLSNELQRLVSASDLACAVKQVNAVQESK